MKKKKWIIWLICMSILLSMSSCGFFYDPDYEYEVAAEKKGENLIEAIKKKDAKVIKGLFSEFARDKIQDFDGKINELIAFMEGDILSVKTESLGGSSSYGEERYKKVSIGIDITTEQDEYKITFAELVEAETDDRIGIFYLDVYSKKIEMEDVWCINNGEGPGIICCYNGQKAAYTTETQEKGEIIAKALKEKDTFAIKKVFSDYAKREIEDLEGKAEKIFSYMKGEVVSTQVYTALGYSYSGCLGEYTRNWLRIKVQTEGAKYIVTVTDCVEEVVEEKQGILYMEIIDEKDIEGEDWYIHREAPNIRYLSDVPSEDEPVVYEW